MRVIYEACTVRHIIQRAYNNNNNERIRTHTRTPICEVHHATRAYNNNKNVLTCEQMGYNRINVRYAQEYVYENDPIYTNLGLG